MVSKEKIISDMIYNGLDVVFVAIIGYLFWSIMGKMLTVFDYGLLTAIITFYILISSILSLNISEVFGKMIPQYKAKKEEHKINSLIFYSSKIVFSFTSIGVFIFLLFSFFNLFGDNFSKIIFWSTIMVIPGIFYIFLRGILYGHTSFKKIFLVDLIAHTIKIFIAILFVYFGYKLGGVYAWIIAFIIATILLFSSLKYKFKFSEFEDKKYFLDNLKSSFIASVSVIFITYTGTLLLSYFNLEATGLYGAIVIIGQILSLFPSIIQSGLFPSISFLIKDNLNKTEILFNLVLKYLIIILIPCVIGFSFFGKQIILLIYKNEFLSIKDILPIYLVGVIFYIFGSNILSVIFSSDFQKERNKILFFSSLISLIFNIVLIYYLSILGAVISFLLTSLILFIFSLISLKKTKIKIFFNKDMSIKFLFVLAIFIPTIYLISFVNNLFVFVILLILSFFYFFILYKLKILNDFDITILKLTLEKIKERIKI
ncbi:MAG: polysaccharide biosynthesis C-terminal domain-containing protein [Candidatus Aenigmatarchaeota archaeon]